MAYEPTLDEVLNSIYGPETDLTEEELAQYLPEPYTAPQYTPQGGGYVPQGTKGGKGASDNAQVAYNFYINKGVPPHIAAGWVGSMMQESGPNLDPNAYNPGGAYGIMQAMGPRKEAMLRAGGKGDLLKQLEFSWAEMNGPERKALERMLQAKTPAEAAIAHRKYYERPGEAEARDDKRIQYANQLFSGGYQPQQEQAQPQGQFARSPEFQPHVVGAGVSKHPISQTDPRLQQILSTAAQNTPFDVQFKSGYRPGDKRQHGKHNAIDVQLVDKRTGKALADYQDPKHFRDYEQFAQTARAVQQQLYPELGDAFRWGGYFSGKKNYGALDLMHFDIGGGQGLGMLGGSWEGGLSEKQRALWQGVQSQGMGAQQYAPQTAPQQSPYQTVKLSDGTTVDVEPGADLTKLAEVLKTNGIDAEPLRQVSLPDGSFVDAPLSYSDEQVLQGMRKLAPDAFGEQPKAESDKKGVLPAMISGAESAFGSMARGAGAATEKAGQYFESPLLQGAGRAAAEEGREWQQKAAERYQELTPEEAKQMGMWGTVRKEFVEPLASGVGSIGATLPAFMIPGVGMAAGVGAIGAQEIGGELAEQERMGQTPDVTKTLGPAAVSTAVNVAGMRFLGPLKGLLGEFASPSAQAYIKDIVAKEGVDAASKAIGSRLSNIAKETGLNVVGVGTGEVASRIAERVASDQPINTPEALAEYEDVFLKSAPLGVVSGGLSGAGRYAAKKGTVEEAQLAQRQAELEAQRAAEAEQAEVVESEAAKKQAAEIADLERKAGIGVGVRPSEEPAVASNIPPVDTTVPPVEPQEPAAQPTIPTEELPTASVPPTAPAAPTVEVASEEIPEPTVRQPEPKHWAEDTLGLPPKAGVVKKIKAAGLEVDNPADHEAITDILNKSTARIAPEAYTRLEERMSAVAPKPEITTPEVPSAQRVQEPAEVDVGSKPQPEIRQEGRGAPEGGEGVRISRPEVRQVEEIKIPEGIKVEDLPNNRFRITGVDLDTAQQTLVSAKIPKGSRNEELGGLEFNNKVRDKVLGALQPQAEMQAAPEVKAPEVPAAPKIEAPKVEAPKPSNIKPQEAVEAWDNLRTPEQPDFASLSKPAQKLWKDEYKAYEGMVDKDAVADVVKFDAGEKDMGAQPPEIREARVPSPDKGIRPIAVEDYADTTNARELVQRVKEKGTDADLVALTDTINKSPHLGAVGVKWVKAADKVHRDIRQKFDTGTTAVAAWDENGKPTIYFNSDSANLREDVPVHELVHGVTEAALQRNPEAAAELNRVSRQIYESLDSPELKQFWGEAIKDNPGEVLAYGLTSPTFRETLKQFDSNGNKLIEKPEAPTQAPPTRLTLWDKFVDAVSRLLGLPTKRKEAFKQQLNDYLNKKADYESQVKRYNEQRPLQEKLDSTFKSLLRETSKKGVEIKEPTAKEVKEEVTPKEPKPLVKEEEPKERSVLRKGMDAAADVIKSGAWTRLETSLIDKNAALREAIKDKSTFDMNGKLRADLVGSANDQIFNVITAGTTEGFPVFSTDGTVMIRKDQKKNLSNITKAVDKVKVKNPRVYVGEIFRALRGEEIIKEDAETLERIDTLRDKAKKLNAYAKTQSFKEGKKASDLAEKYTKQADKLKDKIGGEGREKLVTADDIAEAKRRLEEHPEIKKIMEDVHGLMKSLVDLWEESGLVSKDVAKEWRSKPNYIPLYMAQEDILRDPNKTVRMMGGGAKSLPNVKALKGGEQAINLLENLQRHYAFMTTAAAQNATRKTAARDMELFGAARRTSRDDKQAIMFKEDGKEFYYRIYDPVALDALQAAAPLMNPLMKAAREYTKAFRAVTLVNPLYWYRQLIRDPLHANVVSKTGMVTPIGATLSFAKIIAGASKEYGELKRRGVVGAIDSLSDPARFKKISDKNPGLFKKGADWVMHVHEAADAATRVEVYKAALKEAKKKGMSREDAKNYATMRAREIINFANQGRSNTLQSIRATVPFFSAQLNSLDSVLRAATGKGLNRREAAEARRLFASRLLMIASYTTAYTLAMQDDEDYINSPDALMNWLRPTGDEDAPFQMFSIPFELGLPAKIMPELMVRLNSGTLRPSEAKKMAKEAAWSTLAPPLPIPQLIKPLAEAVTNTDFHTGRDIVGAGQARLVPTEQTRGASSLSIELGRALGVSPIQVEHFGRGYLTELWTVMGLVADKFLEEGQGKPAKYPGEVPIIMGGAKGILTKPERDRDVDTFFELNQAVGAIRDTVTRAQGRGNVDTMERLMADPENKKKFYAAPAGREIAEEMSKVEKAIDQIQNDKSLTPERKQIAIRDRRKWYNELASRGVKRFYSLDIEE
jgi:hypothetical protein